MCKTGIPAADAASLGIVDLSLLSLGLLVAFARGLRLRVSECREDGDLERLSNREALRGSGSVWSKRERFRGASWDIFPFMEGEAEKDGLFHNDARLLSQSENGPKIEWKLNVKSSKLRRRSWQPYLDTI